MSRKLQLFRRRFAVHPDPPKKYGTWLIKKIDGKMLPIQTDLPISQVKKSHDAETNLDYIQISTRLKDLWENQNRLNEYVSLRDYALYLKKQKEKKQGFIQTELTISNFNECKEYHLKNFYGDLALCADCRYILCQQHNREIKKEELQGHFNLELSELQVLLTVPTFTSIEAKCLEANS